MTTSLPLLTRALQARLVVAEAVEDEPAPGQRRHGEDHVRVRRVRRDRRARRARHARQAVGRAVEVGAAARWSRRRVVHVVLGDRRRRRALEAVRVCRLGRRGTRNPRGDRCGRLRGPFHGVRILHFISDIEQLSTREREHAGAQGYACVLWTTRTLRVPILEAIRSRVLIFPSAQGKSSENSQADLEGSSAHVTPQTSDRGARQSVRAGAAGAAAASPTSRSVR